MRRRRRPNPRRAIDGGHSIRAPGACFLTVIATTQRATGNEHGARLLTNYSGARIDRPHDAADGESRREIAPRWTGLLASPVHECVPQAKTIPYEPTPRAETPPATAIPAADLGPHGSHGGNGGLLGCGCSREVEVEGRVRAWPRPSYGRSRLVRAPTTESAAPAMTEHARFARRRKRKMVKRLTKGAHAQRETGEQRARAADPGDPTCRHVRLASGPRGVFLQLGRKQGRSAHVGLLPFSFFCIFFSLSLFPYSNLNSDLNSNLVPNYPHIIL
jgi:hypothetical protein